MRKIWKQKASPIVGKLFFFFIIVGFHTSAQTFSGDEAGIYIEKGTSVYIKDGVTLSGIEHQGDITLNSSQALPDNKNVPLPKKKSNREYARLKKQAKEKDVRKKVDQNFAKAISLPSSENRYRLGLFDENGGAAMLTGNPSVKYTALYERLSFEKYIMIREEERMSYATAPGPVSGILIIHFSRPPPFKGIV